MQYDYTEVFFTSLANTKFSFRIDDLRGPSKYVGLPSKNVGGNSNDRLHATWGATILQVGLSVINLRALYRKLVRLTGKNISRRYRQCQSIVLVDTCYNGRRQFSVPDAATVSR